MANWKTDTLMFGFIVHDATDGFCGAVYIHGEDGEPTEVKNAQKGMERVEDSILALFQRVKPLWAPSYSCPFAFYGSRA